MFGQFAFLDLDTPELLLILLIVLLLFGGKKLPELSRALGTSVKELKKGMNDIQDTQKDEPRKGSTSVSHETPDART